MGRKQTTIKMPRAVIVKCPQCSQTQRLQVDSEKALQAFECKQCEAQVKAPVMQCCVVCAFSDKKCPYSVKMQAFSKGLELR